MSTKHEILAAFATRLAKITPANGYTTAVKKVYYDDIPMGLDLQEYELPAILLLDRDDAPTLEHNKLKGEWQLQCQLWHMPNPDSVMLTFVREVYKAIFADSPTAPVVGAFRSLHEKLTEVVPLSIASDLNMIEANRIYQVSFLVRYRTELYNL